MTGEGDIESLLRVLAPQALGVLLRRHSSLERCEDAVQEALATAAIDWPRSGLPNNPRGWLVTVATRRLIDQARSDQARRAREDRVAADEASTVSGEDDGRDHDDTLVLLVMCCHPALSIPSQIALTLRAVGGLTTWEIAAAFLVPETTMGQRISRAKQRIRDAGATFALPPAGELDERVRAAMHVLYLIFNEGYTATSGPDVHRVDLSREAIRLARELRRLRPDDSEAAGLLALMLLTDARREARTTAAGDLIPLEHQDRILWDHTAISEGVELLTGALTRGPLGAYQIQAAIAAVHDEAARPEETDWAEVLALYELLDRIAPNPMATVNRAVAVAMVHGPAAGLELLAALDSDDRVSGHHLLLAVRGHLLEMAGQPGAAADAFAHAARLTLSLPEKRYLQGRATHLRAEAPDNHD